MKVLLKILNIIFAIIYVIEDLVEIFIIPAIFIAVGLMNGLSWQYYLATVGGFFLMCIILQIILHFVFKRFEKKYESFLLKLFRKKADNNQSE